MKLEGYRRAGSGTTHSTRRLNSILFMFFPRAYAVCCSLGGANGVWLLRLCK